MIYYSYFYINKLKQTVMTDNVKNIMQQFIDALDEATIMYEFDKLSEDEKIRVKKLMKLYIDRYLLDI